MSKHDEPSWTDNIGIILLILGWTSVILSSFFSWKWSSQVLSSGHVADVHGFVPLIIAAVLGVLGFCFGFTAISHRLHFPGMFLSFASFVLPIFTGVWPIAISVVQSFGEK